MKLLATIILSLTFGPIICVILAGAAVELAKVLCEVVNDLLP